MSSITSSVWFDGIDQLGVLGGRSLRIAAVLLRKTGRWPTPNALEPGAPVDVTISYDKPLKVSDADHLRIVHFTEDGAQMLEPDEVFFDLKKGKLRGTAFAAESFSVYAVVYTVDFEYSVNGQTYECSLPGGEKIALSELIEALGIIGDANGGDKAAFNSTKDFLKEVANVEFSDESLVKVTKNRLGNDWKLESLQPFSTDEELTITMKNGDVVIVKVTDAQLSDISSLLTSFGITGATKNSDGSYSVFPGTPYTVSLKFAETENDTFNRNGFTYPLPSGVVVSQPFSGTLTPSDSGLADIYSINYTINTNGTISFTFDIKDGKQQAFDDLRGLSIDMTAEIEFDERSTTIDWNGKAQITVDRTHDIGVNKQSYLGDDGYMYYTVTVSSTGDNKNISLTDTISGTALTLDQNSITETSNHGATFSNKTNKGFNISIPELKHGESATITYRAKVDYDVLARETGVEKGSYGTATTTGNQIKINGEDDNPNNDTAETHADHNISFSSASKGVTEGHYNEETGKRTMNWQITANNEHKTKITYIHDQMGEGSDNMNYSGEGITVKVVNPDWSVAATYSVPWSQLGVSANSTGWTYNIPDQYKDKNYSFVIDYTTDVDVSESIVPVIVKNTVDTDYGQGGGSGKADKIPIISKDYTATDEEKAKGEYHFEIKINEGGDQLGEADYLEVTDSYTNLTIDYSTLECEPADALLSYTHSGNTVTYFVKNGVPVTLRYTASALTNGIFSNTVEVNNQSVTKTGTASITARGTTSAAQTSIKVIKHAGANLLEGLAGVRFELYLYDESFPEKYNPDQKVIDQVYTTNDKGMFTISKIPLLTDEEGHYTHTTAK